MKKILIPMLKAGGGHYSTANALMELIQIQKRPWQVEFLDVNNLLEPLDFAHKLTGINQEDIYNWVLRRGWTHLFTLYARNVQLNVKFRYQLASRLFEQVWKEKKPDLVASVIPIFNHVMKDSLEKILPGTPMVTILTDMADCLSYYWLDTRAGDYICATDRAIQQAKAIKIPDERLYRTSGLVIHPSFYNLPPINRYEERARLGLDPNHPTLLIFFGGEGSRAILEIAKELDKSRMDLQFIFICGRNEQLASELRLSVKRHAYFIEGFTKKVGYYMSLSDLLIGKPGNISINEAMLAGLPVIVEFNHRTMPQERHMAEWIKEKQVGIVIPSFKSIKEVVETMLNPKQLSQYKKNVAAFKNRGVYEVIDVFQQLLDKHSDLVAKKHLIPLESEQTH